MGVIATEDCPDIEEHPTPIESSCDVQIVSSPKDDHCDATYITK